VPDEQTAAGGGSPHHLVRYLGHVRREFRRALDGMTTADLERRLGNLNSAAWIVGHLAWQEQSYWLTSRDREPAAELSGFASGKPSSDPAIATMLAAWERVTAAADGWLTGLDAGDLSGHVSGRELFEHENIGTLLTRVIGHYYLHIGQITVIRKLLGYPVPVFVGSQAGASYP